MRYLLDTNTCIALKRSHPAVVPRMAALPPASYAISTVTAYDLFTGIEKCAKPQKERAKVDALLQTIEQLPFHSDVGCVKRTRADAPIQK